MNDAHSQQLNRIESLMQKILAGQSPYLDYDDAAGYIRKSKSWLEKQVMLQKIPYSKVGAKVIFKRDDLDQIIEDERVEACEGTEINSVRDGMKHKKKNVVSLNP